MKKYIKIDLSDYKLGENNRYYLEWFELMSYHKNKVVIYGVGKWYLHIMDWRGCNFFHGRLPKSPVFNTKEEAKEWLKFQVKEKVYLEKMELSGHHKSEYLGSYSRDLETIHFFNLNNIE